MFELPETITLTRQMRESIAGRVVRAGLLGNSPHKFVWYNRTHDEFAGMTMGLEAGQATARGRWMFLPLVPRRTLVFGECGGRLLFHPEGAAWPAKYHLLLEFEDGSALSMTTRMWGAMELFEDGAENDRQYIRGMRTTPVEPGFTAEYLRELVDEQKLTGRRSVKSLLTQDQLIPGLGNSIAQDIMFEAGLHPKRMIDTLDTRDLERLHASIAGTVATAAETGGRDDEVDLYGNPGGYARIMHSRGRRPALPTLRHTAVERIQYLGGACYYCPACQK